MKLREKGFTSVELAIALLISSIIIGFIYTVYHFSLSYSKKWKQKIELENNAFLCMNQLTADIKEGMDIFRSRYNQVFIQKLEGNIHYCFTVDSIVRNSFRINSESCTLDTLSLAVQILKTENSWDEESFEYSFERNEDNDTTFYASDVITISMHLSNGTKSMGLQTSVNPRNRNIARFNRLLNGGRDEG